MKHLSHRRIALSITGAAAVVACVVLIGDVTAAQPPEETWPPQFPREGATKLFENEHVIVWEQIGRPTEPFAHRHIRDILTFGVEAGPIEVLGPDLQPRTPSPGGSSFTERLYSRGDHTLSYSKAGLGPHVEMAPDPNNVPISIFVEIKGTEPADCAQWSTACR